MDRILTSHWFLATTAACCGVAAGLAAWVTDDASRGARAVAVLIALASTLAVLLLIAWALASDEQATVLASPVPLPEPVVAAARADPRRRELAQLLEEGRALRRQVSQADARVDAWIEKTSRAIEQCRPGVGGYFNALAARPFPDDAGRLDAHLKRLDTIVNDAA
jgi:hypothetical protein